MLDRSIGRYEIVRRIGSGGMGEVYLALAYGDEGFEKTIVIKTILPHIADRAELQEKLISEAKLVATLQHQNIVQVFDLGRIDDQIFVAMEFVDGPDLGAAFRRAGKKDRALPVDVALFVASEALQGLQHAHSRKVGRKRAPIVHRDVSLSNILLSWAGEVKLSDFGLARAIEGRERLDAVIEGKIRYMAPERLAGEASDTRSDIYSVGIVLFTLLTGVHPFGDDAEPVAIERITKGDVPHPSAYKKGLDPALDRIVATATERDPESRFGSARVFRDSLMDYALSRRLKLSPDSLAKLLRQRFRRDTSPVEHSTSSHWAGLGSLIVERDDTGFSTIRTAPGVPAPPRDDGEAPASESTEPPSPGDDLAGKVKSLFQREVVEAPRYSIESMGAWRGHAAADPQPVQSLAISPDGRHALSGSVDATLQYYFVETGEVAAVLRGHEHRVTSVEFSPDGRFALSGSYDRTIKLWDLASAQAVWTLEGHEGWVLKARFSYNGALIASGGWDRAIRIWAVMEGSEISTFRDSDGVTALAFGADARTLLTGSVEGTLKLWDVDTGAPVQTWKAHEGSVTDVTFIPGSNRVLSASDDHSLRMWDAQTGEELAAFLGHEDWVNAVAVSTAGTFAISGGEDRSVRIWDLDRGEPLDAFSLTRIDGAARSVAFSPDGSSFLVGTERGTIRAFRLRDTAA